jgi:Tol biopolymer transport system component
MPRPKASCWYLPLLAAGAVACNGESLTVPPVPGSLEINMVTNGVEPDLDGYLLRIDDGPPQVVGTMETVKREEPPGSHTAALEGVAANCTVADNPRSVTVVSEETAAITFEVSCTATRGTIRVTVTTTGSPPDPDGYLLSLDGSTTGKPIESNVEVSFIDLAAGPHTVTLGGLVANCRLRGDVSRETTVVPGLTSELGFEVTCSPALIAFNSNGIDLQAIFIVKPDGTGLKKLSPPDAFDFNPTWSPDGSRLLFLGFEDLYVMNADGSGRVRLVEGRPEVGSARWSPDGRMIAFTFQGFDDDEEFFIDLWVMRSDGSDRIKLASGIETGPSWSPDSRQIVYGRDQLRIIDVDGTGDHRLTRQPFPVSEPAWSPDGGRIAFVTTLEDDSDTPDKSIFVIDPDGSGLVNLTRGRGSDESPTWSPDGSMIAFTLSGKGEEGSEIAVMNRDGGDRTNLTRRRGFDVSPDWSPDGRQIVYHRSSDEDSEIYVMDADGGGQHNVSNRPDTFEEAPDWAGQATMPAAGGRTIAERVWLRAHGMGRQ